MGLPEHCRTAGHRRCFRERKALFWPWIVEFERNARRTRSQRVSQEGWPFSCEHAVVRETIIERQVHFQSSDCKMDLPSVQYCVCSNKCTAKCRPSCRAACAHPRIRSCAGTNHAYAAHASPLLHCTAVSTLQSGLYTLRRACVAAVAGLGGASVPDRKARRVAVPEG